MTDPVILPNSRTALVTGDGHADPKFYRWFQAIHLAFENGLLSADDAASLTATLSERVDAIEGAGTATDLLRVLYGSNGVTVHGNLESGVEIRGPDIPASSLGGIGPPGLDGEPGEPGPPGPPGAAGAAGTAGAAGAAGPAIGFLFDASPEDPWPTAPPPNPGSIGSDKLASMTSAQLAGVLSDETGSGAAVFANGPVLVTPALGTPASGNLANCTFPTLNQDTTGSAARAGIPQNSRSADYTLVLGDANGHIYHPAADTSARTFTIPANGSVAYPIGTAITFDNDIGAGAITIAITTDTLVLVGSAGSTGSRTLASGGQATALKVTSTRWRISGTGLT